LIDRNRDYNVIYSNCLNAAYSYQAHDSYMNPEEWCADVNSAEEESCREAGLSAKFRGENRDVNVKESCKR
jgi:hypothetical protein